MHGAGQAVGEVAVRQCDGGRQLGGERVRFTPTDRAFLAALLYRLPRDVLRRLRLLVRPETMLRWHRDLVARRHADHGRLREMARRAEGRHPQPTAAVIDSQSIKAAATRGFDGGKKINGRRRHVITDCLGLLLMVLVTAGNVTDRQAAHMMLPRLRARFAAITLVWADSGYRGRLVAWAKEKLQLTLQIVKRSDDMSGFVVLPRRWVVERSLGWLMCSRRLVRDFETLPASSEAFIYFSQAMLLSRRLARRACGRRAGQDPWAVAA